MRTPFIAVILFASLFGQGPARADEASFRACLEDIQKQASRRGMSNRVVKEVVPALRYQPRVIELDRRQPEFTQTFAEYLKARVTPFRIARGRVLYRELRPFLDQVSSQYGVDGRYLVALWGMETNFGGYTGKMPVLDSLATLACDRRRSNYFTGELLTALSLVDRDSLSPPAMKGSWAGAMGHTQFMPSTYRRYAVDGDGDGRVDLWSSERDALASAANFLDGLGWRTGETWGYEVSLPEDFSYDRTGPGNQRPVSAWRDTGVRLADGRPLPDGKPDGKKEAAILVPSGHAGPAFLVFSNFDIIRRWNNSQWYALSVGHLADRIAGGGPLRRAPPQTPALSRDEVTELQRRLNERGFDAGSPDGIIGRQTRNALQGYQRSRGLVADGFPDVETLAALGIRER
jgi:membrane-bound lytic murein transglycosylase B